MPVVKQLIQMYTGTGAADETCVEYSWESPGVMVVEGVMLLYFCIVLARICDDYLMHSLETICTLLNLPEDVAGVSFLALGGSLPELVIHTMATIQKTEVGMGAVIGSAIFNLTVGLAAVALFAAPTKEGTVPMVTARPLLRDCIVYMLALGLVMYFRSDGSIGPINSIIMFTCYALFLVFLFTTRRWFGSVSEPEEVANEEDEEHHLLAKEEAMREDKYEPVDEGLMGGDEPGAFGQAIDVISWPTDFLFRYTIPDCSQPKWKRWWPVTFALSVVYVCGISFMIMTLVQHFGCYFGLRQAFAGLVLLAIGASIPDTITMAVAAKRGHGGMSVSGLVGSNIFDILAGLGMPWLLYNLLHGPVSLKANSIHLGVIFCMVAVFALMFSLWANGLRVTKRVAILPLIVYFTYITVEFYYRDVE